MEMVQSLFLPRFLSFSGILSLLFSSLFPLLFLTFFIIILFYFILSRCLMLCVLLPIVGFIVGLTVLWDFIDRGLLIIVFINFLFFLLNQNKQ